jgi:tRNA dimethylallyltransferase
VPSTERDTDRATADQTAADQTAADQTDPDGRALREHPLIVIVGATGTGKSELALDTAELLGANGDHAEIVNADAMQLYRGMDIGTAKLPADARRGIRHHMLDVLDVREEASVAWYQPRARAVIDEICARDAVPILVGGSGLYVSAVVFDFAFPPRDPRVRLRLEEELAQLGSRAMHERLIQLSPATAERVDPANGRRVVRALEVLELSSEGHGGALPETPQLWRPARIVGLDAPRSELTARLDARAEAMWGRGLLDEVAGLIPAGIEHGVTASRAIGYAQALAQLRGDLSQTEAISQTQQLTRRYARRQVSWFKRYPQLTWLDWDAADAARTVVRQLQHPEL